MRACWLWLLVVGASPVMALEPREIVVLANRRAKDSEAVARHYLAARQVPEANLLLVDLPDAMDISRPVYEEKVVAPLREFLKAKTTPTKCLLTVFGMPLRVGPQESTAEEKAKLKEIEPKRAELNKQIGELDRATPKDDAKIKSLREEEGKLGAEVYKLSHGETNAAIDSELMLVLHPPYPLYRIVPNPLHWNYPADKAKTLAPKTLMVCRLDGPTVAVAKRLVDDAIAVEKACGLKGKSYVDARGIKFDPKKPGEAGTGYEGYDESFRETAAILKAAKQDVTLDDKPEVFASRTCPDAALYTGWYSAGNYVDSNLFVKGAVAWHLASYEAIDIRKGKGWCVNILQDGAAVTIGPVGEPYTIGFPKPAEFFALLMTGEYTVAEAYARSVLVTSWMGIIIGDPLYNPFRGQKLYAEKDLKASPLGAPPLFK
ncbi:MAG: TIGR03790 family protein [Fimbriiglobus sp.]